MLTEKNTSDGIKLIAIILLVRISNVFTNSHSRAMIVFIILKISVI